MEFLNGFADFCHLGYAASKFSKGLRWAIGQAASLNLFDKEKSLGATAEVDGARFKDTWESWMVEPE
jgi:hypothetical protein